MAKHFADAVWKENYNRHESLQRRLKILLGRAACLLELIETIAKSRDTYSDVV